MKTADIRKSFLDFFAQYDHRIVPSSPVIPYDDPTLLFTNAGMNQFKDVFTGKRKVDYRRATSTQKCIRAGGKHNDLDNVGFTARHHTFFEMLGNFSFGDYFKEEAIKFAWEWITQVIGLPTDKLYASVYTDDDDAFKLWGKIAPELKNGRILRFGKKDNYWSMGDIGPCGPCSEIHFDRGEKYGTGPEDVVNGETERFVEIWNLVFMQFDQQPDGTIVDLPRPSVDTGAGLERNAAIIQGAETNYGIDLFQNIIEAISELSRREYKGSLATSMNVVADHLRALTFAIADGAGISNEGQGYVLRRILRRAARHGRLLGLEEPFIYKLVPVLVNEMGEAFPEIVEKKTHVENVVKLEEESFGRTLDTGLELFEKIVKNSKGKVIDGAEAFKLYDTYGFPFDLTEVMAAEHGMTVDQAGFDKAMEAQRDQSRAGASFAGVDLDVEKLFEPNELDNIKSEFVRKTLTTKSKLIAFAGTNEAAAVILDKTPFYTEAGGQVSDYGTLSTDSVTINVTAMHKIRDAIIHVGHLAKGNLNDLKAGTDVNASVDAERRWAIMRNHTVTHLTQKALRMVLGDHVRQSGSYVGDQYMRFDFSHHQPMTPEEIARVERIVNEEILKGTIVNTEVMNIDAAKASGAMALFGEKYDDDVRVVSVGDFSKELCGGTHVDNISQIGPFFITLETGIASGVRRIEAITGREAIKKMLDDKRVYEGVSHMVGQADSDPLEGVQQLRENYLALQKELKKVKSEMFAGGSKSVGEESQVGSVILITHDFGETDRDVMGGWIDTQKERQDAVVAVALGTIGDKRTYMASVSNKGQKEHKLDVGKMSKDILPKFGGRGGGKPNFAQGSVANDTQPNELFDSIKSYLNGGD